MLIFTCVRIPVYMLGYDSYSRIVEYSYVNMYVRILVYKFVYSYINTYVRIHVCSHTHIFVCSYTQWVEEIKKHVRQKALKLLLYRGVHHQGYVQPRTLAAFDLVITSYETLSRELNYVDLPHSNSQQGRRLVATRVSYLFKADGRLLAVHISSCELYCWIIEDISLTVHICPINFVLYIRSFVT